MGRPFYVSTSDGDHSPQSPSCESSAGRQTCMHSAKDSEQISSATAPIGTATGHTLFEFVANLLPALLTIAAD